MKLALLLEKNAPVSRDRPPLANEASIIATRAGEVVRSHALSFPFLLTKREIRGTLPVPRPCPAGADNPPLPAALVCRSFAQHATDNVLPAFRQRCAYDSLLIPGQVSAPGTNARE